jgi:hypothetical protein
VHTELGSWQRAWRRVGKAEVAVEVDADMVEAKQAEEKEEKEEECPTMFPPTAITVVGFFFTLDAVLLSCNIHGTYPCLLHLHSLS